MSFLELRAVCKRYGSVAALAGVDLTVPAGSRTAIVGPSGSGKTTLLRVIAGFDVPDTGGVTLEGEILADGPKAVPAYRRGIGLVAQDGALFPHLTIADNIAFGLPRTTLDRAGQIAALMDMVGLDGAMLRRRPDELSGGQQQRVALARALARKPRLMLLDEPFSSLDTGLRVSTRKAVAKMLGDAQITTLLVTHDQEEALSFADQVAVMRDGRLAQIGAPREIYLRPRDVMIAEFLGDAIVLPAQISGGWARCALGRIEVDGTPGPGMMQIMLRPEQITLIPVPQPVGSSSDSAGARSMASGEIVEIDFAGAVCTVILKLVAGPDSASPVGGGAMPAPVIILRRSFVDILAIGEIVGVAVTGKAHVFAEPA